MQRISFYIDGFNVYHKINEYQEITGICYKWLNYKSLLESLLKPDQIIQRIYFFTAISQFKGPESVVRHNKYITAHENLRIKIIVGKFIRTKLECRVKDCTYNGIKLFEKAEEKQTDVNLALNMVLDARNNQFDLCYLVSSDSDFVPALKKVKEMGKQCGLIIPPQDKLVKVVKIDELINACYDDKLKTSNIIKLKFEQLVNHILPLQVFNPKNNIPVSMPNEYMTSEQIKELLKKEK